MSGLFRRMFGSQSAALAWVEIPQLQSLLAGGAVLLVDVRQPEEYASPPGHLPGAINVPLGELSQHTDALAAHQESIVVVCKTDRRSVRAAAELLAAGFRDVAVLRGGTDAWHAQGLPLE